jgi:hypothetical protein
VLEKIRLTEKIRVSLDSIRDLKQDKKGASSQSRALTFALSISCRLTWSWLSSALRFRFFCCLSTVCWIFASFDGDELPATGL